MKRHRNHKGLESECLKVFYVKLNLGFMALDDWVMMLVLNSPT